MGLRNHRLGNSPVLPEHALIRLPVSLPLLHLLVFTVNRVFRSTSLWLAVQVNTFGALPAVMNCRDGCKRSDVPQLEATSSGLMISKPLQFRVRRRGRERSYRERDHRIPERSGKPFNTSTNTTYGGRGSYCQQSLRKHDTSLQRRTMSPAGRVWDSGNNREVLFVAISLLVKPFKYVTIRRKLSKLVIRGSFENYSGQTLFCCSKGQLLEDLVVDHGTLA